MAPEETVQHPKLNGRVCRQSSRFAWSGKLASILACKKVLDNFPEDVIEVRNALAHQMAEQGKAGQAAVRTRNKKAALVEFTEANCANIRKNLRRHQANLADLLKLV
ncbi:MAG: hypothetical protein Q8M02_07915 [Candidatus Didemnitutus sp.]|nr:hypothetical protein [Candidatus Didemnitutus sp.]